MILIFGCRLQPDGTASGTMVRRVEAALASAGKQDNAIFLATGGQARSGRSEAQVMGDLLVERGIGRDRIIVEPDAKDTLQSVLNCKAILDRRAIAGEPVWAVSSSFHLPRCVCLLRIAGIDAAAGVPARDGGHRPWLAIAAAHLREIPALVYDVVLMALLKWSGKL